MKYMLYDHDPHVASPPKLKVKLSRASGTSRTRLLSNRTLAAAALINPRLLQLVRFNGAGCKQNDELTFHWRKTAFRQTGNVTLNYDS